MTKWIRRPPLYVAIALAIIVAYFLYVETGTPLSAASAAVLFILLWIFTEVIAWVLRMVRSRTRSDTSHHQGGGGGGDGS